MSLTKISTDYIIIVHTKGTLHYTGKGETIMTEKNGEIKFEIVEKIGVIRSYPTGWSKEINLVSWNDSSAKYDIRDWDHTHERMSRGITLHPDEMKKLLELFRERKI